MSDATLKIVIAVMLAGLTAFSVSINSKVSEIKKNSTQDTATNIQRKNVIVSDTTNRDTININNHGNR